MVNKVNPVHPPSHPSLKSKSLVYHIGGSLALIVLYVAAMFLVDRKAVEQQEKMFNHQQSLQTLFVKQAIEDQLGRLFIETKFLADDALPRAIAMKTDHVYLKDLLRGERNAHPESLAYVYMDFPDHVAYSWSSETAAGSEAKHMALEWARKYWKELIVQKKIPLATSLHIANTHQMFGMLLPVRRTGEAAGMLVVVIDLRPMIMRYIAPMRSGKYGAGYLLDQRGVIIYDHETQIVGRSIFDRMHDDYPDLLRLDKLLISRASGMDEYSFTVRRGGTVSRKLIAWNTAKLGHEKLIICLSAPDIEIGAVLAYSRLQYTISGIFLAIALIIVSVSFFQKRAAHALHEREELFREMAENIQEVFWIFDWIEQKTIYVSPAYENIWGRSIKTLLERHEEWDESIYPDDRDFARDSFVGIIETDGGEPREYRIVRPDGTIRWISDRGVAIPDKDGRIHRVVGIAVDITDRKRAEEMLKKFFNLSLDLLCIADINGKFKRVNPAFQKSLGYSNEELLSKPYLDFVHPDDKARTLEAGDNLRKGAPATNFENRYQCKDGSFRWLAWTSMPDPETGTTYAVARDITDKRNAEAEKTKLEAQLHQAMKMEAIGTLAGGIAHDFNNLLMGIQGRASLMLMDADPEHTYYEHLKGIEEYVQSAADLTRQLLAFARGGKYEVQPTDLNNLIVKCSEMFGRTKKEISIHRKCQEHLWTVEADRSQLEQVLMNLFVNAWQSMPGGGDIHVQTRNVVLEEQSKTMQSLGTGNHVQITITDNGVGMDEETRKRVFEPFFTTKEMGRGTGLGLATAYGIIKNHSGYIYVFSKKGEGTTFEVYLPASEKTIAVMKKVSSIILEGSETVLLVDDEDMVIDVGKPLLEKLGYTVLTAGNGKQAILQYGRNRDRINLVILDMVMPEMGGGETYDKLKEMDPDVKVLLSSGYSIEGEARDILSRGCNGFIQKPFNIKELSQKMSELKGF